MKWWFALFRKRQNQKVDGLRNALINAAYSGDTVQMENILSSGVSPNNIIQGDHSPLILPADNGDREMAILLIRYSADVNYENDSGDTDLNCSAVTGAIEIVKALIDAGIDVNAKNRFGSTALGYAIHHHKIAVAELLRSYGATDA